MKNGTQGFTLIELLIVIAIIGILAAVLIPNLLAARAKSNDTAAQAYARNCYTAIEVERDSVTQGLPFADGSTGSCTDATKLKSSALKSNAAVTANQISVANGAATVCVTSVTTKIFKFDGSAMEVVTTC